MCWQKFKNALGRSLVVLGIAIATTFPGVALSSCNSSKTNSKSADASLEAGAMDVDTDSDSDTETDDDVDGDIDCDLDAGENDAGVAMGFSIQGAELELVEEINME